MAMKMTKVELVKMVEELQAEITDLKGENSRFASDRQFLLESWAQCLKSQDSDITGESTSNLGTSSDSEEPTTSDEEFINDSSESEDSSEEANEAQYQYMCDNRCGTRLGINVNIACIFLKNDPDKDQTWCQFCWDDLKEKMNEEGWVNECDSDFEE